MFIHILELQINVANGTRDRNRLFERLRLLTKVARLNGLNLYLQIYL